MKIFALSVTKLSHAFRLSLKFRPAASAGVMLSAMWRLTKL